MPDLANNNGRIILGNNLLHLQVLFHANNICSSSKSSIFGIDSSNRWESLATKSLAFGSCMTMPAPSIPSFILLSKLIFTNPNGGDSPEMKSTLWLAAGMIWESQDTRASTDELVMPKWWYLVAKKRVQSRTRWAGTISVSKIKLFLKKTLYSLYQV